MPRKKKETESELFKFEDEVTEPKKKRKPRKPRKKKEDPVVQEQIDKAADLLFGEKEVEKEVVPEKPEKPEVVKVEKEIPKAKAASVPEPEPELFDEADAILAKRAYVMPAITTSEGQSRSRLKEFSKRRK